MKEEKKKMPKWLKIVLIVLIVLAVFIVISIFSNNTNESTNNNTSNNSYSSESSTNTSDSSKNTTNTSNNKKYGLGETFTFDGFELTLDNNYSFVTLTNSYSEKNGSTVIKLGVTVKNISTETTSLNSFYYDFFGSQGTELDFVYTYFDEAVDDAGDLRPEASYKKYFYILYDGNGKYGIDFDNYSQKVAVEFDITK